MTVFPASAGVILAISSSLFIVISFPRIRGGDPSLADDVSTGDIVFPASAGVILLPLTCKLMPLSFPRIRGGDPGSSVCSPNGTGFSPHPRG